MQRTKKIEIPNKLQIEEELIREKYKHRYGNALSSTINVLLVVAAIAVLTATLWTPVFQLYGNSMAPNLVEGDIVVAAKGGKFETGDIVGFYYGNKLLIKRYILSSR